VRPVLSRASGEVAGSTSGVTRNVFRESNAHPLTFAAPPTQLLASYVCSACAPVVLGHDLSATCDVWRCHKPLVLLSPGIETCRSLSQRLFRVVWRKPLESLVFCLTVSNPLWHEQLVTVCY
jgi:hypothetical protein